MRKILIIDDDPDIRTVMNLLLKKQGYDVETASRKDEALSKMKSFHPDVVLLDVLLSGADGRELCQEIKANAATQHVPVIMFSAHPGAADNIRSYGADDFLSKPINKETLLNKLEEVLAEQKK